MTATHLLSGDESLALPAQIMMIASKTYLAGQKLYSSLPFVWSSI